MDAATVTETPCNECGGHVDCDTKAPLDLPDGTPVAGMPEVLYVQGEGFRDHGWIHHLCGRGDE